MYSICVYEQHFQNRLDVLKQRQFELLRQELHPDALIMPIRGIRIAVHQVLCDIAGAEIRDTGRISDHTRENIRKNRSRLILAGIEGLAVEMESAVIRQYGPESE